LKFVSYQKNGVIRSALLLDSKVYDLQENASVIGITLPASLLELLQMEDEGMKMANTVQNAIVNKKSALSIPNAVLVAPIPNPPSCRDAYAFRQHVATARRNRGVPMIPEFDQYPVFYFTNHNAICGEGDIIVEDDHLQKLDFELEATAIIGKRGKNISAQNADSYIAGYTIMNDLSARLLQMEEMKLNLGPAKGKDFATAIGPWLVTPDELKPFRVDTDFGSTYDLKMEAFHNGTKISAGNMKDMNWTFAEIIERISYGTEIYPGDVIGSGTVGTGCYLEINGSRALLAKEKGTEYEPVWLKEGDTIELTIENLGKLSNRIVRSSASYSILSKKKM
jgi:fumarylacetoacetate (FAA) hydrolase